MVPQAQRGRCPETSGQPRVLVLGSNVEAMRVEAGMKALGLARPVRLGPGGARSQPAPPAGFLLGTPGGSDRLAAWLAEQRIAAVVDATHPFALRLMAGAARACSAAAVPRFRVERPRWRAWPGERLETADSVEEGLRRLHGRARLVFATPGRRDLPLLDAARPIRFVLRGLGAAPPTRYGNLLWVHGRPSREEAVEEAFLGAFAIDALLLRETGGGVAAGKRGAARRLGLPVVVIRRPPAPPGPRGSPRACLAWLRVVLGDPDGGSQTSSA